ERQGGVFCRSEQRGAHRICLWSRLASRVLTPLVTFPCTSPEDLYNAAKTIDWADLFAPDSTFAVEVAGHSPHVTHTQFAGLKVKDGIVDRFREAIGRRPNVDPREPDIRVHLHLDRENASISLDLAGESLHRRGYRAVGVEAPLKENLAAAILIRAGWPQIAANGGALVDPMCGSGTLVIEAGLIAADIAPGIARTRWGFQAWLEHRPKVWQELVEEARERRAAGLKKLPPLFGYDIDPRALRAAQRNANRAGLGEAAHFEQRDVSDSAPPDATPGLVVTNPPYGERLADDAEVIKLHSLLGAALKERFAGWRAAVFTGRPDLGPRLGMRADKMYSLYNGPIACKLLLFQVHARTAPAAITGGSGVPPLAALPPSVAVGGDDFANRLTKNLKHLAKWAKRKGVSCYRVYDADLPDYAVAVDIYETGERHLHVQEYAAPKTIDPVAAERRLREALAHIQKVLDVPASRIHFKIRKSQRGSAQYSKQDDSGRFYEIDEHGCKLLVNFDDYLDTGLFLDHRPLRYRIQQESSGKRFLNLFCYTASATAHAFKGGAAQSLSIDLSSTYLDWGERNLHANHLRAKRADKFHPMPENARGHWLLQADCMAWLKEQPAQPRFDLILLDPPTFSNSKRMEGVLDIQRDHIAMIQDCVKLLAPGGTLYFSTNR